MALLLGRDMVTWLSESLEPKLNHRNSRQPWRETQGGGAGRESRVWSLRGLRPGPGSCPGPLRETQSPGPAASPSTSSQASSTEEPSTRAGPPLFGQ